MLAVVCLLPGWATFARTTCDAQVTAELERQEETADGVRLEFEVRVEAGETCSTLTYDLIIEELLPNKQWKSVRKTRDVELREGRLTEVVEHRMSPDLEFLGHRTVAVRCACGAED